MAANEALNRVAKWRTLLVGRILGTRPDTDPAAIGFRDLFDKLVILRAEVTAITCLLIEKGVCTPAELDATIAAEASHLDEAYRAVFPGWESTPHGLAIVDFAKAQQTMQGWPP